MGGRGASSKKKSEKAEEPQGITEHELYSIDPKLLGQRLKEARLNANKDIGYGEINLRDAARNTGVLYLGSLEAGGARTDLEDLGKLATYYKTTPRNIIRGITNTSESSLRQYLQSEEVRARNPERYGLGKSKGKR